MNEQKVRLIFNLTDKNSSSRVVSNRGIAGNYIEGIHAIATDIL